jgi:taurine dioxygenase
LCAKRPEGAAILRKALVENLVICIRGQKLESAQYRDAMRQFGTLGMQRQGMRLYVCDEIGIVSTDVKGELGYGARVVQGES